MPLTWTTEPDIIAESFASIGKLTIQGEGGIRSHTAKASDDTGTALLAVAAVESAHGTTHPTLSGVPYLRVRVQKVGPRKWRVIQFFGWGPDVSWGGSSATTAMRAQLSREYMELFTTGSPESDGLPGDMNGSTPLATLLPHATDWYDCMFPDYASSGYRPGKWIKTVPTLLIRLPFRTDTSTPPLTAAMVACLDKVNDDTVEFVSDIGAGVSFSAGQVKFVGADIDWRRSTQYAHVGDYCFEARATFKIQSVYRSSGKWRTKKQLPLASADFNTPFGI